MRKLVSIPTLEGIAHYRKGRQQLVRVFMAIPGGTMTIRLQRITLANAIRTARKGG